MYSKLFVDAGHLLALPIFALFLFIAIFVGVVAKVIRTKRAEVDLLARLPFAKEQSHE